MVTFATGMYDRGMYAVKFFATRSAFDSHRAMCQVPALEVFLPRVHAELDGELADEELRDAAGRRLPPCIVMERGESLNEWSRRAKPDIFQAVAVRSSALRRQHSPR